MPNVLSPRDLVSRPDNMDETVPHTHSLSLPYNHFYIRVWGNSRSPNLSVNI